MADAITQEFANFEANISLDDPVTDYEKLMDDKMRSTRHLPINIFNQCWTKISGAARETIWKLLFDDKISQRNDRLQKAADLLKLHKDDACFYQAREYNEWIVLVRDELLRREMFDFWKNEIVEKELGPCWARDSDLFDDNEDSEPEKFYKYAGCEAHWLTNKSPISDGYSMADTETTEQSDQEMETNLDAPSKKLSIETPLEDYKNITEYLSEIAPDDDNVYYNIFAEARDMIWRLLFSESTLSAEYSKKAAELLEEYKGDACFFGPYEYNDWIPKLKDELIKRNYLDFWRDIIVKKELGLCWAKDSDYFDDMEDKRPLEFYKLNEEST